MPVSCCAPGCTERFSKGSGVNFHRFPTDTERRKRWIIATKRTDINDKNKSWEPSKHDRLCSRHFIGGNLFTKYKK